jgi:hypothetical protein
LAEDDPVKTRFRSFAYLLIGLFSLIVLALVAIQIFQAFNDRKHGAVVQGVVLDQDGQPLSAVEVTFRFWNWRYYVPIPWTPTWIAEKQIKTMTDTNGAFTAEGTLPRSDFVSALKAGYRQDGQETEYMWRPFAAGPGQQWTLHLVSESLIRQEQIRSLDFESVGFPQNGQLCIDLAKGEISDTAHADIVFLWKRLPTTADHGEYGKYVIRVPKGGVWFWEQERLFAPKENYEDGMVFFFSPSSLSAYMKKRRAEFFVTSRDGQVYARVFAQLDTGNSTLSVRARVNSAGNRFVDAKADNYKLGVYGSLSPDYLNPAVPWWIPIDPTRGQVILSEKQVNVIFASEVTRMRFPSYFAGHYQTPARVLGAMIGSALMQDHYVPQSLAKNLAAPTPILQQMMTNTAAWRVKEIQTTLALPEDVRRFLTALE